MSQQYEYRGFRLHAYHHGPGWKVAIYAPDAMLCETEIPDTKDQNGLDDILFRARRIVDDASAI